MWWRWLKFTFFPELGLNANLFYTCQPEVSRDLVSCSTTGTHRALLPLAIGMCK